MELTLLDFGCDAPPPPFLPPDKWEDILAISVLPGPLDSLCIHIAEMAEQWEAWYMASEPERLPLPLRPTTSAGELVFSLQEHDQLTLKRLGYFEGWSDWGGGGGA